jgi:diguanylate cyclase (GGDEF)-like protein
MEKLIRRLPKVSSNAVQVYEDHLELLINYVNNQMSKINGDENFNDKLSKKTYNNHMRHGEFMLTALRFDDYRFFYETIIWVYNFYQHHGFAYENFLLELEAWTKGVKKYIDSSYSEEIINIYRWMIENHDYFIEASENYSYNNIDLPEEIKETCDLLINYILDNDYESCLKIVKLYIGSIEDLYYFYDKIIIYIMNEIGFLWQKNRITVAREHLASSIVNRILSYIYSEFLSLNQTKGDALLTTVENEHHGIGCRIIADSLERDGWNVQYLGMDTPNKDLISYLEKEQPFLLGLSVTMAFNLNQVIKIINEIRSKDSIKNTKIIIGGKCLNEQSDLWKKTGADAWAKNSIEAVQIARKWWIDKQNDLKPLKTELDPQTYFLNNFTDYYVVSLNNQYEIISCNENFINKLSLTKEIFFRYNFAELLVEPNIIQTLMSDPSNQIYSKINLTISGEFTADNNDLVFEVYIFNSRNNIHLIGEEKKQEKSGIIKKISDLNNILSTNSRELSKKNYKLIEANKRIERLLRVDELTGLSNRRHFMEFYSKMIAAAKRNENSLSLVMCDLDGFKSINDNYGHVAGDLALKAVAEVFKEETREEDMVARFGGDEFIMLLNETPVNKGKEYIERIRKKISKIKIKDLPVKITISMGVTELKPDDTKDTLFRRADNALYSAKENGKNQVVVIKLRVNNKYD